MRPALGDKHLLLALSLIEGGAVMAAELVGAQVLAPLYGSSLYVWGTVIGVTLISLAAGYYLGGLLSRRSRRRELLYWGLLIAALLIAALPRLAERLMFAFDGFGLVPNLLLMTAVYLLPPLLLLGAVSPLVISLLEERIAEAGKAAGTVYAVSTIGGILATFLTGFYLIPRFGLGATAMAAAVAVLAVPLLMLLRARRYPALVFPALMMLLLVHGTAARNDPVHVLYRSEGLLGQLMVVDLPYRNTGGDVVRTDRVLFVNRMGQTWVNLDSGQPVWEYDHYLRTAASLLPPGSHALLIGLGGGVIARELQATGFHVDAVELDQRIARISRDYFGYRPEGALRIDDGRHYLRTTRKRYDLVVFDVFRAEIPPAHLLTLETFQGLKGLLRPGGMVIVNYNGFLSGRLGYGGRSVLKTLRTAGYTVHVLATRGAESARNTLFLATTTPTAFDRPRLPLVLDGRVRSLPELFIDTATLDPGAMVLRDDRPVLAQLNLEAAAVWRQGYTEAFTKRFTENGIPLFE